MTKQNSGFKWSIRIGGGFKKQLEGKERVYPRERLEKFLNVDASNEREIIRFCNDYQYLPADVGSEKLFKVFGKEQRQIKKVASELKTNYLTVRGSKTLSRHLGQMVRRYGHLNIKDIRTMNDALGGDDTDLPKLEEKTDIITEVKHHLNSNVSLWEDLINQFVLKQSMKNCRKCGKFFLKKRAKHFFCSDKCQNSYNQK